jgi:transcriptional regulator with XRE-family HTH domain
VSAWTPFQQWLGEQLIEHDLTTASLAAHLGVLDGEVEDWFFGRAVPAADRCFLLAQFFETTPDRVLRLVGWDNAGSPPA